MSVSGPENVRALVLMVRHAPIQNSSRALQIQNRVKALHVRVNVRMITELHVSHWL